MKTPQPERKRTSWISWAIIVAFMAVSAFGIVIYRNTVAVRQDEALVNRSYAIREKTQALLSMVKDMETGQRGFVITGVLSYLEPYYAGLNDVQEEFARLRRLTQDEPAQHRRLDRLQRLVHEKRAVLAEAIKLRGVGTETEGWNEARKFVTDGHGKALMDEMRLVVRDILQDEQKRLADREATAKTRARTSARLIVVGNLMTLALLIVSGAAAHIDRKKRDEAEATLRFSQAELGAIFDSTADGIMAFNEDCTVRLMNPAAANIYHCDGLSALGRSLLDFFPARIRDLVANDIRDFVQSDGRTRRCVHCIALRSDGTEFPCDGALAKAETAGGEQFVTLVFRDLSESQARDAKIREQVEILNQVRDTILVCDLHDQIIFWNRGAKASTGIPPSRRWVET